MKLKPIIVFASIVLLFSSAGAQRSRAVLKGGLNLANISNTEEGRIDDANTLASFQVGIMGDLYLNSFMSFQPGLFVTGKGSKTQDGNPSDANYFKATTHPIYLEIPANLVFKLPLSGDANFFVGAGPYMAIGIAGKNKVEGKFLGNAFSNENEIEWSDDDPSTIDYEEGAGFGIMKRFDYGLNGTVGFDGKNALFSVNYGLGLAKIQSGSNSSADDNNKHRVLSFTVGFKL